MKKTGNRPIIDFRARLSRLMLPIFFDIALVMLVGALAMFPALSLTLSASMRSAGKVVEPMAINILANVLNAAGNYMLIFGKFGFPAMGVAGAAWATAFARTVQFLLLAARCS